jgi:hypothetical protein
MPYLNGTKVVANVCKKKKGKGHKNNSNEE